MRSFFYVLCAGIFCFISCTQDKLEINNYLVCPVFSYEDESGKAEFRICAFVQTAGEIGYLKLIQLSSENLDLVWTISDFQYIYSSQGKWAGSSALRIPRNSSLPHGKFLLTIVDSTTDIVEKSIYLNYPKKILMENYKTFLTLEDYQKVLQQYIVFYDVDGMLLHCEPKSAEKSISLYAENISDAVLMRTLWISNDKTYAVLSPPLNLDKKAKSAKKKS